LPFRVAPIARCIVALRPSDGNAAVSDETPFKPHYHDGSLLLTKSGAYTNSHRFASTFKQTNMLGVSMAITAPDTPFSRDVAIHSLRHKEFTT
jgi:hypothetical protein